MQINKLIYNSTGTVTGRKIYNDKDYYQIIYLYANSANTFSEIQEGSNTNDTSEIRESEGWGLVGWWGGDVILA